MPQGYGEGSKATQFKPLQDSLEKRFHDSYMPEPNSGCWIWLAGLDNKGYGRITLSANRKMELAHRISWQLHFGKTEQFILHKCDMPCCVNPDHLYPGTQKDNMRDAWARNRKKPLIGEKHPNSKLTEIDVLAIRLDPRVQTVIAKAYGVSQSCVSLIKQGRHWKHM